MWLGGCCAKTTDPSAQVKRESTRPLHVYMRATRKQRRCVRAVQDTAGCTGTGTDRYFHANAIQALKFARTTPALCHSMANPMLSKLYNRVLHQSLSLRSTQAARSGTHGTCQAIAGAEYCSREERKAVDLWQMGHEARISTPERTISRAARVHTLAPRREHLCSPTCSGSMITRRGSE